MSESRETIAGLEIDTIVREDCFEFLSRFDDQTIPFICADPDYGVGISFGTSENPRKSREEIGEYLIPQLMKMREKSQNACVFWSSTPEALDNFMYFCREAHYQVIHLFVWYKTNGSGPTGRGLARRWEAIWWLSSVNGKRKAEWSFLPDVLAEARVTPSSKENAGHPTQKPVALIMRLIRFFTMPGDLVVDPFMGSGTTAIAAMQTNRHYLGCDVEGAQVVAANRRIMGLSYRSPAEASLPLF